MFHAKSNARHATGTYAGAGAENQCGYEPIVNSRTVPNSRNRYLSDYAKREFATSAAASNLKCWHSKEAPEEACTHEYGLGWGDEGGKAASNSDALGRAGEVLAFGANDDGQLCLGDYTDRHTPTLIPNMSSVMKVASGLRHTVLWQCNGNALPYRDSVGEETASQLFTCGTNVAGQLGVYNPLFSCKPPCIKPYGLDLPKEFPQLHATLHGTKCGRFGSEPCGSAMPLPVLGVHTCTHNACSAATINADVNPTWSSTCKWPDQRCRKFESRRIRQIAAAGDHTLVLVENTKWKTATRLKSEVVTGPDEVWGWGDNSAGAIGPTAVSGRTDAAFSSTDVGKTVRITGNNVLVDGNFRKVNWGEATHHDLTGKVKSVDPKYKGKVELEDDQEFENPADGLGSSWARNFVTCASPLDPEWRKPCRRGTAQNHTCLPYAETSQKNAMPRIKQISTSPTHSMLLVQRDQAIVGQRFAFTYGSNSHGRCMCMRACVRE